MALFLAAILSTVIDSGVGEAPTATKQHRTAAKRQPFFTILLWAYETTTAWYSI
jgi:hypothetical protein